MPMWCRIGIIIISYEIIKYENKCIYRNRVQSNDQAVAVVA